MEETVIRLAKFIDEKRFGKFRATVVDNNDPEKRGVGFVTGFLASLGLIGTALWGVISAL